MLKELDPSLPEESVAIQVTVVTPTWYRPKVVTMLPAWSVQSIVPARIVPSQASLAVGVTIQSTTASGRPASTFTPEMSGGTLTIGPTMSAEVREKSTGSTNVEF